MTYQHSCITEGYAAPYVWVLWKSVLISVGQISPISLIFKTPFHVCSNDRCHLNNLQLRTHEDVRTAKCLEAVNAAD